VYASAFADEFRDSHGFGWDSSAPGFNLKILMEKKVNSLLKPPAARQLMISLEDEVGEVIARVDAAL